MSRLLAKGVRVIFDATNLVEFQGGSSTTWLTAVALGCSLCARWRQRSSSESALRAADRRRKVPQMRTGASTAVWRIVNRRSDVRMCASTPAKTQKPPCARCCEYCGRVLRGRHFRNDGESEEGIVTSKQLGPRGLYFEDLEVGDSLITPGRTVTETDLVLFTGLSGDYNQLHTNVEYAKETVFGKRIAHGPLGLVMAVGLAGRQGYLEGTAQAFLSLEWKFKAPIFIGDTIHVQADVVNKKAMKSVGGGVIVFKLAVLNQESKVVQQGTWRVLLKSDPDSK
jgi:acyl dehydratase